MGFSPSTGHQVTTSIFSNIVDAATGSFTQGLTVSGIAVSLGGDGGGGVGEYALIEDANANGTVGGTFTAGAFRTRRLNTKPVDEIGITLSSDQFTLPAGTYRIHARAPGFGVSNHVLRLRNITDSTDELIGSAGRATSASGEGDSVILGQFTISATKTFEIQHRCSLTVATFGFGTSTALAGSEVYTQVALLKVA